MKQLHTTIVFFLLLFYTSSNAQSLESQIIGSSGSTLISGNTTLNFTTGETVVAKITNGTSTLSQGFQKGFTLSGIYWNGSVSSVWSTAANWDGGIVPTNTDNVLIIDVANDPIISTSTTKETSKLTIKSGGILTINPGYSLLANSLVQNGTFIILSDATSSASFMVKTTSEGNITYKRFLATSAVATEGWHLIASPVNNQAINGFTANFLTSGVKYAISEYNNTVTSANRWNYFTSDGTNNITSAGNFSNGKGYSAKIKTGINTLDFTGTIATDNVPFTITDGGTEPAGNKWNLIGNPYPSFMAMNNAANGANNFININSSQLDPAFTAMYLWNATTKSYDIINHVNGASYLAPGQAFFVKSLDGGGSINFTENMQSHQTGNLFLKSTNNTPQIALSVSNGTTSKSTEIKYIEGTTIGLDAGYDAGLFNGTSTNFSVFTHLVSNDNTTNFSLQCLPPDNYENMIIPIGIKAINATILTFSTEIADLPVGMNVYLEDKNTNIFTLLSDANATYQVTLNENLNGIGRFYIHTTTQVLSNNEFALNEISMYKSNNKTLKIIGLHQDKSSIKLFTLLGQEVFETKFFSNGISTILLPKLSAGAYVVRLKTTIGTLRKKIVID